ncbi:branched-chain amino acid ABC transporter substrate-binding protein [Undibacterium arcticum]
MAPCCWHFSASASAQEQIVKIGHSGPLSGANAFAGKDNEKWRPAGSGRAERQTDHGRRQENQIRIAVGRRSMRSQSRRQRGTKKLVDGGVKYVMGPYCSGVAIPASRVYNEAGVMVSTVGTNPKVTQGGYKNLYRIIASDSQVGSSMAGYAAKVLKAKTVGVIDDRTAFGQGVAAEFVKVAKSSGLQVAGHEFTTDKATDFSTILTNLKAKNVDAIFFSAVMRHKAHRWRAR